MDRAVRGRCGARCRDVDAALLCGWSGQQSGGDTRKAHARRQSDRSEESLAAQVQALGLDRTRLADSLDAEAARSRKLETTNREIAQRLDTAIASIHSVLETNG